MNKERIMINQIVSWIKFVFFAIFKTNDLTYNMNHTTLLMEWNSQKCPNQNYLSNQCGTITLCINVMKAS